MLAGALKLGPAVEKAKKREMERSTEAHKLAELRERHVELADLVADESLTLGEAMAAAYKNAMADVRPGETVLSDNALLQFIGFHHPRA